MRKQKQKLFLELLAKADAREREKAVSAVFGKTPTHAEVSDKENAAITAVFDNAPSVPYKTPPKNKTKKWNGYYYRGKYKASEWKRKYIELKKQYDYLTD